MVMRAMIVVAAALGLQILYAGLPTAIGEQVSDEASATLRGGACTQAPGASAKYCCSNGTDAAVPTGGSSSSVYYVKCTEVACATQYYPEYSNCSGGAWPKGE